MKHIVLKSLSPKPLLLYAVMAFSNSVYSASWISTPSRTTVGSDIEIQGGGVPNSTQILIKAYSKHGDVLFQSSLISNSDGTFSDSTTLDAPGEVTFVSTVNNIEASSVSLVMENE
ncbi:hypothetical protein KO519_06715 [Paraglaciecola agarilytica]|uniref:hypothetical protein n=1 Tax=Paraglaciecola chathamensis TaxID=368405 RepID=UPI001C090C72|nr:hypothetical protein [Paraglaciecola agarilytica]MBU3017390.1 hypothetical protein [Paraglaciecola agarilytica]